MKDSIPESIPSSQLDTFATCSENTGSLLNVASLDEQNSSQGTVLFLIKYYVYKVCTQKFIKL